MKNRVILQKRLILMLISLVMVSLGCNFQRFFNDVSGTNTGSFPTHFRCSAEKGLLFAADIPRTPDGLSHYISYEDLNFFLDFYNDEDDRKIMIEYTHDITDHAPIISSADGNKLIGYSTTKLKKTGQGGGYWNLVNPIYFSGTILEKSIIEYSQPEGSSDETESNYWFVGYKNFLSKPINNPQVFLCFYTGEFDMEKVITAGEKGFAEFCSLPDYGYLVCNPK